MSKLWLVARYEYERNVFKKSFLAVLLIAPSIIAIVAGLIWLISGMDTSTTPIGYVDHAGVLVDAVPAPKSAGSPDRPDTPELVPVIPYQTEEDARTSLEAGTIRAYYVIAPDYRKTNRVDLIYIEPPSGDTNRQFWDFMRINRLHDLDPVIARRAVAGSNLVVRWPDEVAGGAREFSDRTFVSNFLPIIIVGLFVFLLFTSSGYLMQAVADEKENRTVEILFTSVSSQQLISGKVLGIAGIALTQLTAWVVLVTVALVIASRYPGAAWLQSLSLDLRVAVVMILIAIPTYVTVSALMAAAGATMMAGQETQQTTFLIALPFMLPFWLAGLVFEMPDGPLAVGLSLFPPTAITAFGLRLMFAPVPDWQVAVSITLLILFAVGSVWIAGRAFRLGMLRYGRRIRLRELLLAAGRGARETGSHG